MVIFNRGGQLSDSLFDLLDLILLQLIGLLLELPLRLIKIFLSIFNNLCDALLKLLLNSFQIPCNNVDLNFQIFYRLFSKSLNLLF